jgi:FtsH-binding integral membrane protein
VNLLASTPQWERALVWLPAIVIGTGLVIAVLILLTRAFVDSIRESGHRRLIYAGLVGLVGAVLVLTWLGISLPRE